MRTATATIVYCDLDDLSSPPTVITQGPKGRRYPALTSETDDDPPPFVKRPRIRGPTPAEEECVVCGDKASGYHYNALTCEGCKGFFRRSVHKDVHYLCQAGQNCTMDTSMRRKCQYCRLQKCLRNGMRVDLVIPEEQCRMKRMEKQHRDRRQAGRSQVPRRREARNMGQPRGPDASQEASLLVSNVLELFQKTESPAEEALLSLAASSSSCSLSVGRLFSELVILEAQQIHEFIQNLPGYSQLTENDQRTILRSDLLLLRAATRYDLATDVMVFGSECQLFRFSRDQYAMANPTAQTDAVFEFCRSFSQLKPDRYETCLLMGMAAFSEKSGMENVHEVQSIQETYTSALREHVYEAAGRNEAHFGRLLLKLAEMHTIKTL